MKIALIIPNTRFVRASIRLGPLYLASYLRSQGYRDITVIDARHARLSRGAVSRRIKDVAPDVIGISGLSMEYAEVHELARLAKEINGNCKVIVGGPYATSSYDQTLNDPHVDFAVIGEGERTIVRLINALEEGRDYSAIEGLAFKNGQACVVNPAPPVIEDLDAIPFPAWDLIDMEEYFRDIHNHSQSPIPTSNRTVPLFTSRGCPYRCTYCHNIFGKKIRFRSVENVLEEIETLIKKYRVKEIEVLDDCFNFDLPRAKRICDEIIRRGIRIALSFPNALRVDRMDEELIAKLKQAGTRVIFYAIESASPRIQKIVNKNLDLEKARHIIAQTAKQDIVTCGFFMLGFPGETREEMQHTLAFAKKEGFHIAIFFFLVAQPRTEIFIQLEKTNAVLKKIGPYHYDGFSANVSAVPDSVLVKMHSKAYREFYFRPRQIWRIWRVIPNKASILRKLSVVVLHTVFTRRTV